MVSASRNPNIPIVTGASPLWYFFVSKA
jgi:hypothetical protein